MLARFRAAAAAAECIGLRQAGEGIRLHQAGTAMHCLSTTCLNTAIGAVAPGKGIVWGPEAMFGAVSADHTLALAQRGQSTPCIPSSS